ncbi:MAG: hypothetical protein R6W99_01415, partial [Clostridia bacterium]
MIRRPPIVLPMDTSPVRTASIMVPVPICPMKSSMVTYIIPILGVMWLFSMTTTEAETTPPVFDNPSDEDDEEDENSEGDDEQTEEVLPVGAATFKLVTRQEYDEESVTRVDVSTLFYRL